MASLRMLPYWMVNQFRQFCDRIWLWLAILAALYFLYYYFFFSRLSSYIANLSTEGMIQSDTRKAMQLTVTGVFDWPRKKPTTVIATAAEATMRKGEISIIVKDCVADELRHLDNHIADILSTLQGRLPTTLRRAINDSVTSIVKARIHRANDELLGKMVIGTMCPEENTVRALQEKVDGLGRLVHGSSKSDSQLESTIKQQNENISGLTNMVNTLMSANDVNQKNLSKLQDTVDNQALQVASVPKIMADIKSYETNTKDVAMPDARPMVDTEIITAIETKIHALEASLKSANTSIDAQTSAFENRIEQIEESVKKVTTTDRNTLPSDDRVMKIEATLFDSTGIIRQVEVLDNRIKTQECLPRVPPSLSTKLRALEANIEDLEARMNNCENAVTDVRQNYHRSLDAIDGVKPTVQQYAGDLDGVRTQIEDMRKHIYAIDDDLVKDDTRMKVLKNMVETIDQKVKEDSEDLTKLYRRVGGCEEAWWRLSGEEDPQHRPSSPLAPIEESSSEDEHDTTMDTQGSRDQDIPSPEQIPVDGVEAEHAGIAEDLVASALNEEAVNDEDPRDTDPGSARPPNLDEDTGVAEILTASTFNQAAVTDEDTKDTELGPARPPSAAEDFTKDLVSGYKRSDEEPISNGSGSHGSGSVSAIEPQHVSSGEVDAGEAGAEGEEDDENGFE
jgi:predicted  nucleic acid-binding Zn-ribbon protein